MTTDTNIDFKALHKRMQSLRGSLGLAATFYGCTPSHVLAILTGRATLEDDDKREFMHDCILRAIRVIDRKSGFLQGNIKKYRNHHRFTQEELGAKLLVTKQTISNWENSVSSPTIDQIIQMADIFKTPLDDFWATHFDDAILSTELTSDPCPDYEEQFKQLKHQLDTVRVDLFKVAKQQEVTEQIGELTKMVGQLEGRVNSLDMKLDIIETYLGTNMPKVAKAIQRIEQHLKEIEQPPPPPLNWFKRLFSK